MKAMAWRRWTALIAAYALAIQTLLVALSLVPQAAAAGEHVLCLTAASGQAAPDHQPVHPAHQADCCTLALAKVFVTPTVHGLARSQAIALAAPAIVQQAALVVRGDLPFSARGPPVAI